MREGILIPGMQSGRAGIRFGGDDCCGGLQCGLMLALDAKGEHVIHPVGFLGTLSG